MKSRTVPSIIGLLLIIILFFSGCGYHLRGFGDALPKDVNTIAIASFINETYEADMEVLLSLSLAEEFSKARRLTVVAPEEADLLLTGFINSFSSNPVAFSSADEAVSYRVESTVDVTLKVRHSGEVIWKGKGLKEIEDYQSLPGDVESTEINRDIAKRTVASELAEIIYDRVFEGF